MTRVKSGWCYIPFEVSRVVKILVVEPQDASRGNLCDELSRVGFVENVRVADCAQLAEDILRDFIPDIVIVDMQLPEQGRSVLPTAPGREVFQSSYASLLSSVDWLRRAAGTGSSILCVHLTNKTCITFWP
jgi:DNA-binding NarL/FixJ family response regulator